MDMVVDTSNMLVLTVGPRPELIRSTVAPSRAFTAAPTTEGTIITVTFPAITTARRFMVGPTTRGLRPFIGGGVGQLQDGTGITEHTLARHLSIPRPASG